jgi:hypothetical protein
VYGSNVQGHCIQAELKCRICALQVFNDESHRLNVYGSNVEVDYRGYEVTVENLIRVLTGELHSAHRLQCCVNVSVHTFRHAVNFTVPQPSALNSDIATEPWQCGSCIQLQVLQGRVSSAAKHVLFIPAKLACASFCKGTAAPLAMRRWNTLRSHPHAKNTT